MYSLSSIAVLLAVCIILCCNHCDAFVPHAAKTTTDVSPSTKTRLNAIPPELVDSVDSARGQFYLWFFGASGGGGVALSGFPKMFRQFQDIQALKGSELSLGGETIGISPLCGYPEDIFVKDAQKIVNNKLSIEQIVEKYPIENNFLSKNGYITFDAFEMANQGCNPLTVRAIFDTFAQSQNACDPNKAQEKIDDYKNDITTIAGNLLQAKLTGYSAIGTLLFLLGLAASIVLGHFKDGWFPEWSLASGIFSIPDYWV